MLITQKHYLWSPKPNACYYLVTYLVSNKMLLNKVGPYLFKFEVETKGKQTTTPGIHISFVSAKYINT